jgi:hypothetical protein
MDNEEPPALVARSTFFSNRSTSKHGKNLTEWKSLPYPDPCAEETRFIKRGYGMPKRSIKPKTPAETLKLFITADIVDEIVTETNREAERRLTEKHEAKLKEDENAAKGSWKPFTEVEFWAYVGLEIQTGVQKQVDVPKRELFLEQRSDPIYKATMSMNRFEDIRSNMRFDDRKTRKDRKTEMGKLAPIKKIFDIFIGNLRTAYEPHTELTLDEQLFGFRGRCSFTQYIASKPERRGIKIFWLCDGVNGYALNGKIYTGKEGNTVTRNLAAKVTQELVLPYHNTFRVITMDNYFTNLPTVEHLKEKNLAVVGTVRNNKPDLPSDFKERGNRSLHSAQFGFRPGVMLVSYVAKPNKVVNFMSSYHNAAIVDPGNKFKPEVTKFYNKTKIGVDLMDQKTKDYTTAATTRRWPMAAWRNIVDISGANAEIIYQTLYPNNVSDHRRRFLKQLALELTLPLMRARLESNCRLPATILSALKVFGVEKERQPPATPLNSPQIMAATRVRCYKCTNDNKVSKRCQHCQLAICGRHSRAICEFCMAKVTIK